MRKVWTLSLAMMVACRPQAQWAGEDGAAAPHGADGAVVGAGPEDLDSADVDGPPVRLTLTSPVNGATLDDDGAFVVGSLEAPPNTGVVVNQVLAHVVGNRFYVPRLLLVEGTNLITVVATTQAGERTSLEVTVTCAHRPAFHWRVSPAAGVAPLTVTFTLELPPGPPPLRLSLDLDGDDVDETFSSWPAQHQFTYGSAGVTLAHATVTAWNGVMERQTLPIVVAAGTEVDARFVRLWQGLNDALARGDTAAGLSFLTPSARPLYGPVFAALEAELPSIVASYSPLLRSVVGESVAEYAVVRSEGPLARVFLVDFVAGVDGVWRIDSM